MWKRPHLLCGEHRPSYEGSFIVILGRTTRGSISSRHCQGVGDTAGALGQHRTILISFPALPAETPNCVLAAAAERVRLFAGRATIQQSQIYRSANRQTKFEHLSCFITDLSTDETHSGLPRVPAESPLSGRYMFWPKELACSTWQIQIGVSTG